MANSNTRDADFWVFRDGRKKVPGGRVLRDLLTAVEPLSQGPITSDSVITALILAGELESALADSDCAGLSKVEQLTDALAAMLPARQVISDLRSLIEDVDRVAVPQEIVLSPPEGFAYYALHPLDFANLAEQIASSRTSGLAVIGIRSIGTALSAIATAACRQQRRSADRITVRPTGHPYNRTLEFTPQQLEWVRRQQTLSSDFLVVDEGPGRSGSSFLSVGEALVAEGVSPECILFLGSRPADPAQLCAHDAASRWNRFRFAYPETLVYRYFSNDLYIGGGIWRKLFINPQSQLPACWPQMERFKFLSCDKTSVLKFEGFGRFGDAILHRARYLARAGFGPSAEPAGDGMIRYQFIPGILLHRTEVSNTLLERIAHYCAFRKSEFSVPVQPTQIAEMLRFNLSQAFDIDWDFDPELLATKNPVLVDGRMQPHEWIRSTDGDVIKVDGCTHGDDHFFPGPTDIAWDLAGAIIEWNLDAKATEYLLATFHRLSGDDLRPRIPIFTVAYTVFRLAYCKMARTTLLESDDEPVLRRAIAYYRAQGERRLLKLQDNCTPPIRRTRRFPNYSSAAD
ncbi:MAG TPA: hypothetical protein VJX16_27600 [Terriglobales bacterium]|nr:hypothetical protein [Terriglobales bacterium]